MPDPLPPLPQRDPAGHKGSFGTVAVVGGSAGPVRMIGGPALAAIGALRAGAGLARLVCPQPVLDSAICIAPSATGLAMPVDERGEIVPHEAARVVDQAIAGCACLAIGPGLGVGEGPRAATLRAITQEDRPVVVDADALNCLADLPEFGHDLRAAAILTPHPGEFRRVARAAGMGDADLIAPERRTEGAQRLAQVLGCIVVLKGAHTVVADALRSWTDDSPPNPVLGTAGTGDVLTGMIAAIVAQAFKPAIPAGSRTVTTEQRGGLGLFDCARLAVRAHAAAAAQWRRDRAASGGMLALELADRVPAAMESLRAHA